MMTQAVHISRLGQATTNHKIREKTSNEIFALLICYAILVTDFLNVCHPYCFNIDT